MAKDPNTQVPLTPSLAFSLPFVQNAPLCSENNTATVRAVTFPVITSLEMLDHPSRKVICVVLMLYFAHHDSLVTTEDLVAHFTLGNIL